MAGDAADDRAADEARAGLAALIGGFQNTALAYFAVRSGLADSLAGRSLTLQALARDLAIPPANLLRALGALAAIGLCREDDGAFALTPMGELLAERAASPLRSRVLVDVEQRWEVWKHLTQAIRSGEAVFGKLHGMSPWEYRNRHPEQADSFNAWLMLESAAAAEKIAPCLDLSDARTIADIGGGYGGLLAALLGRHPCCRGVLFDQPRVIEGLRARSGGQAPPDRTTLVGGDFFDKVPVEADVFILKSLLHDWDDAHCARILSNCRRAMRDNQRLLLIERLLGEEDGDRETLMTDLLMLLMHGGRERTLAEYRALLEGAGFVLERATKTPADFFVLECRAVG